LKGEQLHNLIISLNQSEKNQVTRFLNRSVNPDKICVHLYQVMVNMPIFNEAEALEILYPGNKRQKTRFEASCDYLAQLIVTALANKDPRCFSQLPFIQKAIEKKMFKFANKYLVQALKQAHQEERISELYLLSLKARELAQQTEARPRKKAGVPSHAEIFRSLCNLEKLEEVKLAFGELRQQMLLRHGEGHIEGIREQIQHLQATIGGVEPGSQREQAQQLKLFAWSHFMMGDYATALDFQEQLFELSNSSEIVEIADGKIHETSMYLRLLFLQGEYDTASQIARQMWTFRPRNAQQEEQRLRGFISAGFISALCMGNTELGRLATRDLQQNLGKIREAKRASLIFYAIQFSAYTAEWREVLRWSNELLKLPQKIRKTLQWQIPMMQAMASLELEDYELGNQFFDRFRRQCRQLSLQVPKVIAKSLGRVLNVPPSEARLLLVQLRDELTTLRQDPNERMALAYFDVRLWIDARLRYRTIQDIAKDLDYIPFREFHKILSA